MVRVCMSGRDGTVPMSDMVVPRLRMLIVALVAIVCAVACHVHIRSVGTQTSCRLEGFAGTDIDIADIRVLPSDMATVTEVRYEGDVPVLEIEGLHPGEGTVAVITPTVGGTFALRVDSGNVVVTDGVNFRGWESVGWSLVVCFAVATGVLAWNFAWLRRRSQYGYEMILSLGSMMFCLCQAIEFMQTMLSEGTTQFADLAVVIVATSERFLYLMLPLVAVVSLLVAASNVTLVRREGAGPRNLLGAALGLALVGFCVAQRIIAAWLETENPFLELGLNSVVSTVGAFFMILFLSTCACAFLASRHRPSMPRDYLIVLGCGLGDDGSPTPLLAGRIAAAMEFAEEQGRRGMPLPKIVGSGGRGADEPFPEAEAMRRYLVAEGFPEERILMEDTSTSTQENFSLSGDVIRRDMGDSDASPSVAFATTNYHVLRGYVYAREAGMDAEGIASPTRPYFWPNAFLREFVGLLVARPVAILLALAVIVLVYGVAEYAVLAG